MTPSVQRAVTAGVLALTALLAGCSSAAPTEEATTSTLSCPNHQTTTTVTGSPATSYGLLENVVRLNGCARFIPTGDLQAALREQITPGMDTASRVAATTAAMNTLGSPLPSDLQPYDVGQLDGDHVVIIFVPKA